MSHHEEQEETLMTKKSLHLSLSPPRCAPYGTAQRSVLTGINPLDDPIAEHHSEQAHSNYNLHSGLRERLAHLVYNSSSSSSSSTSLLSPAGILPHPHVPLGPEVADQLTRFLGSVLPLPWQNSFRDSGGFRSLCDSLVTYSIPLSAIVEPTAARHFLRLSRQCEFLRYGPHDSQRIEVLYPPNCTDADWKGMIYFVHGGAWGSGKPWFYRLVALSFLKLGLVVAIVGYRVYPMGDTTTQVHDLNQAYSFLAKKFPKLCGVHRAQLPIGLILMGHSSGAHITKLMIMEQVKGQVLLEEARRSGKIGLNAGPLAIRPMSDAFVGLSGPYDISHHFDYEAARGVEELSPMKPANGSTREAFRQNTPAFRLKDFLATFDESNPHGLSIADFFPKTLLVHGIEDDTVPFTATSEAAKGLGLCGVKVEEVYLPKTAHQDVVMQLMLGGRSRVCIVDWLQKLETNPKCKPLPKLPSKL